MQRYEDRYDVDRWQRPEGRTFSISHAAEHAVVNTAGNVLTTLWNPSSTLSLYVLFIQYDRLSQGTVDSENGLALVTTQGTPTVTITPDADNDWGGVAAPASGAVLNHSYSAEPTKATPRIAGNYFEASPTPGYSWQWGFADIYREDRRGFRVPPGKGLAIYRINGGGSMQGYANYVWAEY